jgi:hypothetical protein
VIDPADYLTENWVATCDFVALNHVYAGAHGSEEEIKLIGVVLGIAISVKDKLFGRKLKSKPQRASIAERLPMRDELQMVVSFDKVLHHFNGIIGAAVLDHDNFIVVRDSMTGVEGSQHHRRDCARVVICGKEG